MYRIISGSAYGFADTAAFIELLDYLPNGLPSHLQDFFRSGGELFLTRAPGRLDLMGGIADYSGSLVLELPIAAATHVALQLDDTKSVCIMSLPEIPSDPPRSFEMSLDDFREAGQPIAYASARAIFEPGSRTHWAAYVAGAFLVLMRERGCDFKRGARILIHSAVPQGKGVSSSAALEVAAMEAITAAYDLDIASADLASLCQKVENLIAGAPCGVMDQMTAACGEAGRLLELLCQPDQLRGSICLPRELELWGIDSGIRHDVGGAGYGTVRAAAFMGYRLIAAMAGLPCAETERCGLVHISDNRWQGYLANIGPSEFQENFAPHLPEQMWGAEFLEQYKGITDSVTAVGMDRSYPVFQATRHPIYEHTRVNLFADTLKNWQSIEQAEGLGQLMYQSHASYSACGLGSSGTDELVALTRQAGAAAGLYGAKITGGGSGGTVVILGRREARPAVEAIAQSYADRTGYQPTIICGSSPGAGAFGHLRLARS